MDNRCWGDRNFPGQAERLTVKERNASWIELLRRRQEWPQEMGGGVSVEQADLPYIQTLDRLSMEGILTRLSKLLPDVLKQKIRQSNCYKHRSAIRLAKSARRIDICAAQFAHILHLSKHPSIEGKTCLEIGAGLVLTHALVCYLLGAKSVFATDIAPCAQPESLLFAVRDSVASIPRDILAPFSDHSQIRERLNRLLSIPRFSFDTLKELGVEYQSRVDFAAEKIDAAFDFIYSFSVLEHVATDGIRALLDNLVGSLKQGGAMIHCIHLEDHEDIDRYPFDFLKIAENQYSRKEQFARGNRIRCSEWKRVFGGLEATDTDLIYRYYRLEKALPGAIDPSISYCDEHDLRTSHIGVYTRRIAHR